jgi:CheY-like chemotaxis protein
MSDPIARIATDRAASHALPRGCEAVVLRCGATCTLRMSLARQVQDISRLARPRQARGGEDSSMDETSAGTRTVDGAPAPGRGGMGDGRGDGPQRGLGYVPALERWTEPLAGEVTDRKRRRILVVDDNREASYALALLLGSLGHEVRTADDGDEAVAAAEQMRPDAILLDLNMPRMDGYTACRRIREAPWGRNLLMVAVTARGEQTDRRDGIMAGFDFHLTKPADAMVIVSMIAALGE